MFAYDYLKVALRYKRKMGRWGRILKPALFSEKIQWLKLYDHNPSYTGMADKVDAKDFATRILGPGHVIPTISVCDSVEEIDWDSLPAAFVMKCAHDSGGIVVVRDKSELDRKKAESFLRKRLKRSFWSHRNEWAYKDVPHRIIIEEYIENENEPEAGLVDYKFMCFDGKAVNVMLCIDRAKHDVKYYFFDRERNLLRINQFGKAAPEGFTLPLPDNLEEMFDCAEKLSRGLPFVRVALYNVKGRILFGEMTFYPKSGLDNDLLPETDIALGELLRLPSSK